MEEKIQMKFEEELEQLLKNEWFWLGNFNTNEKQNEEQMKHNEKMAQSLKEGLEEKYPNISLDINTIKRLGVQYTKWTRQKESERALEEEWKKYKEEQEQHPDWISAGSVLDVQVTHRLFKREEELRKNKIESPMEELKIIIAAGKVDPNNLDMNMLEYLRKGNWGGKFTNQLLQTTYELYCDGKEKDVQIEGLKSEKNEILNQTEEKNNCITSQNAQIKNLLNEKQDLENQLANSNEKYNSIHIENVELKKQVNVLQKMLSKTLNFCNTVRNSRFGRIFFNKQIKELPAPDDDKSEREI